MPDSEFRLRVEDGNHRQASWLELFFDLAFVICIATLSQRLSQNFTTGAGGSVLWTYVGLFVPTWWVWNQYTPGGWSLGMSST